MQIVSLKQLLKSNSSVKVKPHRRKGKIVRGYVRAGQPKKIFTKQRITSLKASPTEMEEIIKDVNKNVAYLVYMGKIIANTHGLPVQFIDNQPQGDLADLISAGKHGMILGGMEWLRKDLRVDQLTQMKTRAKQQMRNIAVKLRSTVALPADVIKDLAIVAAARQKLLQAKAGGTISAEEVAAAVVLKRRTREGKSVVYKDAEKLERIKALMVYEETQTGVEIDDHQLVSESDVKFWAQGNQEQQERRQLVNNIIDKLVSENKITTRQRDILNLKFYFDKAGDGYKARSFETIAKMFEDKTGIKNAQTRKKLGDTYPFTPKGLKAPLTGIIIKITPEYFVVRRKNKKKEYRIMGKPPLVKIKGIGRAEIWRQYKEAINTLIKQPELKHAWDVMKSVWHKISKSLSLFVINPRDI